MSGEEEETVKTFQKPAPPRRDHSRQLLSRPAAEKRGVSTQETVAEEGGHHEEEAVRTVEEPVVEEPAAEEPVVEEPAAEEPVVEEPAAEKPVVEEPAAEEPAAEEPVVEEPTKVEDVAKIDEVEVEIAVVDDTKEKPVEPAAQSVSQEVIDSFGPPPSSLPPLPEKSTVEEAVSFGANNRGQRSASHGSAHLGGPVARAQEGISVGTMNFDDGTEYVGQFQNQVPEGRGIMRYNNGSVYEGDWHDGARHGYGVFTFAAGSRFEGTYSEDQRHGFGIYTHTNGDREATRWNRSKQLFCEKRVGDLDAITEKAREAMKIAKAVATAIEASEPEPPTPAVDLGSAKEPVEPETPLEPFEDERLDVFHASLSSALRAEKPMKVVEKTKQAAPTEGARATLEGKWRGEVYYPSTGTSVDVTLFFAKDKEGRLLGRADIPYYDVNNGTLNVTAEDPENGYTRFGLIVDDEGAAITFECYLQGIAKVSGNVACKGAAFADDTHGQFKATKTGEVDGVRARFGRSAANKEAFFPLFYELINVTNPSIAVSIPAFILTVTSGILPMVFLLFMARALNSGIRGSNAFDLTAAGYYAAYGVLIGVIYGVVLFARDSLIGLLGEKVSERLRARAFLSLANADIQFVEEVGAAALTSKIEKSSDAVKGSFVESTFVIIRNFVAIFTGVVGGLLMGWQIALVAIAVAVIFGLFLGLLMRHRNRHAGVISRWSWLGNVSMARDLTAARGIMELERRMIFESLDAVRSVHYTNNALSERSRFLHAASERARKSIMISLVDGFFDALTFTVLLLGLAGVVYYASYIVSSVTQITYAGTSVFIIVSMFYSVMAAMDLSKAVIAAKRGFRPATDLFRLLERVATEPQTGEDIHNVDGNISFDSCVFGVKATSPISFSVPEKTLTVVLPTAANTHTSYGNYFAQSIAAVLMRVADPLIGRIRVDKKAIDSVSPHSLRKFVAVIDANPRIFTATIEYNIRYAKPQGTKEEVREALRVSGLANIVRNMPQGLETVVGQTPLSLAMRRKIAIARAYLQNPAIVIIDDLTLFGGMSEGELEVEYALAELVKGRTAICFTPSPILVKKANEILIMDETGLVSDRGSFSQLCNVNKEFNSIYGEEEE